MFVKEAVVHIIGGRVSSGSLRYEIHEWNRISRITVRIMNSLRRTESVRLYPGARLHAAVMYNTRI